MHKWPHRRDTMTRHLDCWRHDTHRPEPMAKSTGMLMMVSVFPCHSRPAMHSIVSVDIRRDEIHGDTPSTMNRWTRLWLEVGHFVIWRASRELFVVFSQKYRLKQAKGEFWIRSHHLSYWRLYVHHRLSPFNVSSFDSFLVLFNRPKREIVWFFRKYGFPKTIADFPKRIVYDPKLIRDFPKYYRDFPKWNDHFPKSTRIFLKEPVSRSCSPR